MRSLKITVLAVVLLAAFSTVAFAWKPQQSAAVQTPAQILADITDLELSEIATKFSEGKSLADIAADYNVSDKFKEEFINQRKEVLNQKAADGVISQARADAMIAALEGNENLFTTAGRFSCGGLGQNCAGLSEACDGLGNCGLTTGDCGGSGRGCGRGGYGRMGF